MGEPRALSRPPWRLNLALFAVTVASVFLTSLLADRAAGEALAHAAGVWGKLRALATTREALVHAAEFTATLLGILGAHELGHYVASRLHRVDASLPYFIPLPLLSPFGTMGAVIRMRGTIPTRRALLDIGASGPLAGLALALPLYAYGAARSRVVPIAPSPDTVELGESLIVKLLDHIAHPHVPAGSELFLSPVAFGAWAGMFVTMVNLLPVGQLDGGHVAYALFGRRQDVYARRVHAALPLLFFARLGQLVVEDLLAGRGLARFGAHLGNALFWLVWFELLAILGTLSVRDRPSADRLGVRPRVAATLGLVLSAGWLRDPAELPLRGPALAGAYVLWLVAVIGWLALERARGALADPDLLAHPPTAPEPLDGARVAVAVVTLLFFVGLFMPTPIAM